MNTECCTNAIVINWTPAFMSDTEITPTQQNELRMRVRGITGVYSITDVRVVPAGSCDAGNRRVKCQYTDEML